MTDLTNPIFHDDDKAREHIASDSQTLTFVERSHSGPYKAKEYHFTLDEFIDHVGKFAQACGDFAAAMEFEELEIEAFQHAALSVKNKP